MEAPSRKGTLHPSSQSNNTKRAKSLCGNVQIEPSIVNKIMFLFGFLQIQETVAKARLLCSLLHPSFFFCFLDNTTIPTINNKNIPIIKPINHQLSPVSSSTENISTISLSKPTRYSPLPLARKV